MGLTDDFQFKDATVSRNAEVKKKNTPIPAVQPFRYSKAKAGCGQYLFGCFAVVKSLSSHSVTWTLNEFKQYVSHLNSNKGLKVDTQKSTFKLIHARFAIGFQKRQSLLSLSLSHSHTFTVALSHRLKVILSSCRVQITFISEMSYRV